jgi:hypothetical protein
VSYRLPRPASLSDERCKQATVPLHMRLVGEDAASLAHFLGRWTDALASKASALGLLGRMDLLLVNVRQSQPEGRAADLRRSLPCARAQPDSARAW